MPAWLTLGAVAVGFGVTGAFWLAGALASMLVGEGWRTVPFGFRFATQLAGHGPTVWWPTVNPRLIIGLAAGIITLAVLAVTLIVRAILGRRPQVGDMFAALASPSDVATLTPAGVRARAIALRPSLAGRNARRLADGEAGLAIGVLEPGGPLLSASWEDVALAIMAPRAGKTSSFAIPAALSAPGCLVATENKAGLWAATASLRAERTGRAVWVFDPNLIARTPQVWWWNPLDAIGSYAEAFRFAGHFTQTLVTDEKRDFWTGAAQDLLAGLFLAAAVGERPLTVVYGWLNDSGNPEPERLLRAAGFVADAESLAGRRSGAVETREGIFENARTAAQCLRNPQIMGWVTPTAGLAEFNINTFLTNHEALYLMAKDDTGSAAPLVAGLVDAVFTAATALAERAPGGRLDPPATVILDEAANIVRIADLPALYSHLGSRGIATWTILQSRAQGERVWGKTGFAALWSAATVKVIGSGIDDANFAEDISRLIGDHDVPVRTSSHGPGHRSDSVTVRRERVLPADRVRALPKGTAIMFATGARAALVKLRPWFEGPDKSAIEIALSTTSDS
jgi:type IV secretory pathway TraG/TraD family ATPase VirD4